MKKTFVLLLVIMLVALLSAQSFAADWAAVRKDAQHTSHADDSLSPPLALVWANDVGYEIAGSPAIAGDTVYYGINTGSKLIAVDLGTGKARWTYQSGGDVQSTPSVVNDSVVFGSYDGNIYRVRTSDGSLMWKSQLSHGMYSSPLVFDGRVYIGTDGKDFYALDLATGHIAWTLANNTTQGSPAGDRGKVFIGMLNGHVYALDAPTGRVVWAFDTSSPIHSSPMIFDGKVFIATRGGTLYAFDEETGTVLWKANLGYKTDATPSLDLDSRTVIIGTYGGYVKAYHTDNGTLKWTSGFIKPMYATAAVSGDTIYGITQDGWMFALNTTDGSGRWGLDMGEWTFSSPAIANGYLVIGTMSHHIAAFKTSAATENPSPTPALSGVSTDRLPGISSALSGNQTL